ncbi:Patatin-like phospholipase [Paraburkholderia steynii]|uniref:Patatin-like phospholipase n=1 Tax=Paraburkholderia steynii TaxID=1245441 RepID=A0A7Z7FH20_9BURK|nr:patatin-like phospholipase family protein [Paraburkholderia steynii]SDH78385.1 Patatin-like phospholipase [Paraburkholderia steynii]
MKSKEYALSFEKVQEEEKAEILKSRQRSGLEKPADENLWRPRGLAFSGGGIRSATFCLGVLQAICVKKQLNSYDYLSTVSGGGYIGAFLTTWIQRKDGDIAKVEAALARSAPTSDKSNAAVDMQELDWLRRYSNYLTPRAGLLSLDTITLIAAWLRNVALNWILIVSFWWLVLLAPRVVVVSDNQLRQLVSPLLLKGVTGLSLWIIVAAAVQLQIQSWDPVSRDRKQTPFLVRNSDTLANLTLVIPIALWALVMMLWLHDQPALVSWTWENRSTIEKFVVVALVAILLTEMLGSLLKAQRARDSHPDAARRVLDYLINATRPCLVMLLSSVCALTVGFCLLLWLQSTFSMDDSRQALISMYTFLPPSLIGVFCLMGVVFVGLAGSLYRDRTREWWSRLTARLLVVALPWLGAFLFAFYVPPLVRWALLNAPYWLSLVSLGWVVTTLLGATSKSAERLNTTNRERYGAALNVAAGVGVILICALLAWILDALLPPLSQHSLIFDDPIRNFTHGHLPDWSDLAASASARLQFLEGMGATVYGHHIPFIAEPVIVLSVIFLVFGLRIEINRFSLQEVYRNRLTRCYLGASNEKRMRNPFTGFDLGDDMPLKNLKCEDDTIVRPFHLFNTAMNIAQGKNLAWQERKAASFVLTPLHVGYRLSSVQGDCTDRMGGKETHFGFRPIAEFARGADNEEEGISVGGAVATSGAALSPEMGYHTKPTLSFLLTLFNLRLGRWCPNPSKEDSWKSRRSGFAPWRLLQELAGRTNEYNQYICLSDGGHFENLGIYELIRRQCEFILAVDATADGSRAFEDLGNAVRKCRIDFGVEINFDLNPLRGQSPENLPQVTYVVGNIRYPDGQHGRIVLIKASMCRPPREPADVQSYATRFTGFPHQSTADQFFDESQFESYRKLGYLAGCAASTACKHLSPHRSAQAG